ncbi:hypothetical protein [Texcoconibacillus texcoconensis]|uniref:Magnesium-transporting ATPase (P-type) n=1 Tax=Texcoconibacillus texcoconensis TaxID=1095777 RepID=A0A840QQJ7_9BACI|nr:hypothetical protein [Texcoconibacillus texcoconensis]MBB5173619.1 magnesium-transporting ATPase (P-type) [Texcoconibacillus texcoconensis]
MSLKQKGFIKRIRSIWKALLISCFSFCGLLLTAIFVEVDLVNLDGLFPSQLEQSFMFFFALFISTLILGELFAQINLRFSELFFSVFIYYLLSTSLIHALFASVFQIDLNLLILFLRQLPISFIIAIGVAYFNRSVDQHDGLLKRRMMNYFRTRSFKSWGIRSIATLIFMFLTFYAIDLLVRPFIETFYTSSNDHDVFVESLSEWGRSQFMLLQSLFLLLVTAPIFALWRGSKSAILFWIGFPLFVLLAVVPFFEMAEIVPFGFRFTIFIEITAVVFMQSIILVQFFYVPIENGKRSTNVDEWTY